MYDLSKANFNESYEDIEEAKDAVIGLREAKDDSQDGNLLLQDDDTTFNNLSVQYM